MLQELYCRNYKVFGNSNRFPLAPLTVLVGPNNAGKSSVLDLVRMISTEKGTALYSLNLSPGSGRLRSFNSLLGNQDPDSLEVGARTTSGLSIEPLEDLPTIHLADDVSIWSRFEALGDGYILRERSAALHPQDSLGGAGQKVFTLYNEVGPPNEEEVTPKSNIENPIEEYLDKEERESTGKEERDIWVGMPHGNEKRYIRRRESDHGSSLPGSIPTSRTGPYARKVKREWSIDESLVQLAFKIIEEGLGGESWELSPGPITMSESYTLRVNSKTEAPALRFKGVNFFFEALDLIPKWVPSHKEDFWRTARDLLLAPLAEKISDQLNVTTSTHLPSFRADPKRYYGPDDSLTALLKSYEDPHPLTEEEVEKWLATFEIGSNLDVEQVAPDLYAASVERNGERRYLADLGSGTAQLLPLILKLTVEKSSGIMLLEEPEANLHPNHQARLADLMVELMNEGHQILVETHSEYLVRRLQYLVASDDCESQQTSVLYIDALEDGADRSPNIRTISIDENGQLSEPLGAGFFDQATDLMIDLFEYGSEN